ncbi:MAG: ion transporter [Ruminococcus sp.]|nr:ion transporter [Ruminococcus sp.]
MKDRKGLKRRVFEIIQIGNKGDLPSQLFDWGITAVILLNITAMFCETFDGLRPLYGAFEVIEAVTVLIFCVEYALRIWTSDLLYPKLSKKRAVLRFLRSFDGVVDLLTILPFFYLSGFIAFRMLRVVRIFHLFRINAQYDSFSVITTVLYEKRNQIFSSLFIILILMFASSIGMYSAEHEAQPGVFKNAFSGLWWSMSTLLTVGYGDIYPVTAIGRIMAIFIAFLGVGAVAIPTGIISAGFVEQYSKKSHSDSVLHDIEEIGEIRVEADSELIGMTVDEIQNEYDTRIYLIFRSGLSVIAADNVVIQAGDILVVHSYKVVKG